MPLTDINIFTAAFPSVPDISRTTSLPPLPLAVAIASILFLSLLLIQALRDKALQSSCYSDLHDVPKANEIPSSILRQKVTRKQLRDLSGKIDVAVVGSGIGALSSASVLAKAGYKVAVFEQVRTAVLPYCMLTIALGYRSECCYVRILSVKRLCYFFDTWHPVAVRCVVKIHVLVRDGPGCRIGRMHVPHFPLLVKKPYSH